MKAYRSPDDIKVKFDEGIEFRKEVQLNSSDFAKFICKTSSGETQ